MYIDSLSTNAIYIILYGTLTQINKYIYSK